MTSAPECYRLQNHWWRIPAFILVSFVLIAVLVLAFLLDFARWLVSGIWPIETRHPEKPGSRHPLS